MKWHISFHNETIINENDELENKFSYQPCHLLWLTTTNPSQADYQHKHHSGLDIRQVVFIFLFFSVFLLLIVIASYELHLF